ncbi:MAG: glycosyltransferase family 4 protein [Candidatus Hodarchaeales archaeon]
MKNNVPRVTYLPDHEKRVLMFLLDECNPDMRVLKEAEVLGNQGFKVIIVAARYTKKLSKRQVHNSNVLIIREDIIKKPLIKYFHFWLKCWIKYRKSTSKWIHCHDLNALPPGFIIKKKGMNLVYDSHDLFPHMLSAVYGKIGYYCFAALEKLMFKRVDHVLTANEGFGRILERNYGKKPTIILNLPPKKTFEIISKFVVKPKNGQKRPVITYMGNIVYNRGYEELVEAAIILNRREVDVEFLIIGTGPLKEKIERLVVNKGISHMFRFTGKLPYLEAMKNTARADIGLILFQPDPNNWLGVPNKLFEYMACGVPVLASNFPLLREFIKTEDIGVVVNPLKPEMIAKALLLMLTRPEKLDIMRENGIQAFNERYNWHHMVSRMLSVYKHPKSTSSEIEIN